MNQGVLCNYKIIEFIHFQLACMEGDYEFFRTTAKPLGEQDFNHLRDFNDGSHR